MKTVLITGATGFLGRHTAALFHSRGWKTVGLGTRSTENAPLANLTEYLRLQLPSQNLPEIVRRLKPNVCIHCAGRASVELSMSDPAADFNSGVDATFNLLDAIRVHAPECRVVYLSSAAVYGNPERLPIGESDALRPISSYGYHKMTCEILCEEFHKVYGVQTAAARIFSAYGPGLRRQVIWDMCRKALTEPVLRMRGTGDESRDFIHARDVAAGLYLIAEKAECRAEAYNLATGTEATMRGIAELILAKTGRKIEIETDGIVHPGVPRNWRADLTRLHRLGFKPEMSLEHGIEAYAQWCHAEVLGE
jgi:UDP-glucose 4-epimerase